MHLPLRMNCRKLIISIIFMAVATSMFAAPRAWEEVNRLPGVQTEQRVDATADDGVYTTVSDGYVYVVVRQRTTVKIFTILGQLIVQDTLQPGIYRYKLTSRGIYLLKVGSITRRVTL